MTTYFIYYPTIWFNLMKLNFKFSTFDQLSTFLLDWRQVLSYDVSFLNIRIVVNSVINLVNKNLPRTVLQICMFHFNKNYPTSTRRHGNFAGVHTLLRILLSSNSAVLINIITGVLPPHFDFVVYYVLCQCYCS
jgi:hypothetical protein